MLSCRFQPSHCFHAYVDPDSWCGRHFPGPRSLQTFVTEPSFSYNSIHKTYRYYCNQDGCSFPSSPNWGWWEVYDTEMSCMILKVKDYYFTSASIQSTNLSIQNTWQCFALTRVHLPVWTQTNKRTPTNVTLIDVFFRKCWSLNHTYIISQSMRHWLVLSGTRRERKQTSYCRKSSILAILIFKTSMMLLPGCGF